MELNEVACLSLPVFKTLEIHTLVIFLLEVIQRSCLELKILFKQLFTIIIEPFTQKLTPTKN